MTNYFYSSRNRDLPRNISNAFGVIEKIWTNTIVCRRQKYLSKILLKADNSLEKYIINLKNEKGDHFLQLLLYSPTLHSNQQKLKKNILKKNHLTPGHHKSFDANGTISILSKEWIQSVWYRHFLLKKMNVFYGNAKNRLLTTVHYKAFNTGIAFISPSVLFFKRAYYSTSFKTFATFSSSSSSSPISPISGDGQVLKDSDLSKSYIPNSKEYLRSPYYNKNNENEKTKFFRLRQKNTLLYMGSFIIFLVGLTYATVPLYRLFCQKTGFGGTPTTDASRILDVSKMKPLNNKGKNRKITVHFTANTGSKMPWSFIPCQEDIHLVPGETALAFYNATNRSNEEIVGVATYNVVPQGAASYFNKIQCFCFEEQRLSPGESIDMPVYFYIDPEILYDVSLEDCTDIVLSYTFFPAKNVS